MKHRKPLYLPERPQPRESCRRLTFSPLAWLKLNWFLHAGDTEVGGFGISGENDPLYVEDFVALRQRTTEVAVAFEDAAVADFYDTCVDAGLAPARFSRLWIHTHPGDSPTPSWTDEETFARVFGSCDWAVMFIVSRTGRTYARLSFSAGPGGDLLLPVDVDWSAWPNLLSQAEVDPGSWQPQWKAEFEQNVIPRITLPPRRHSQRADQPRAWDADLLLGETWPWAGDVLDLDQLHEQATYEEALIHDFEIAVEPKDYSVKEVAL